MKFREIYRFELAYQAHRVVTWVYGLGLFAFGFLLARAITPADSVFINSPTFVAFFTVPGGLIWMFLAASVAGEAAARDIETGTHPLTYTSPVSKAEYLGGRFLAAFTLNAAILLALQAGVMLSMALPHPRPHLVGPWMPAGYLVAYFVIALPNAFVVTSLQFVTALRARRAIAAYFTGVLVFIVSVLVGGMLGSVFDKRDIARLFDFLGFINILGDVLQLTPLERNTAFLALRPMFLTTRVVWIGVAIAALASTYGRFQFSHPVPRRNWNPLRRTKLDVTARLQQCTDEREVRLAVPDIHAAFVFSTYARQTMAVAWTSFGIIAKSRLGLTLVAGMALGSTFFSTEWFLFLEEIQLLPRTEEVLRFYTPGLSLQTIWVVVPLLIVFFAGELIWHERDEGVSEIVDTAPVPEWVLVIGKFLGLSLVIAVWMAFMMAAGMLVQVYLGYPEFEIALYLKGLFGFQLADYLLFAVLALVVHVIVNQKYLASFAMMVMYGALLFAPALGIEHKLLIYAADPGWTYSPMRGFEPTFWPWLWFKLYWAAWALLLGVLAKLLLARGRETALAARAHTARDRFTRRTWRVAATAVALVLVIGGFIFYNTNLLNAYRSSDDELQHRAEYERRYGHYQGLPQPRLAGTTLRVDIRPADGVADIRGTYRLENRSAAAIDAVHVATRWGARTDVIGLDRPARVTADDEFGHYVYALEQPLAPGESVRLDFIVRVGARGFTNNGIDPAVVSNGTFFESNWLPAIGYQWLRELSSASDRRDYGLPPRSEIPSLDDSSALRERPDGGPIDFEATVSTDLDQIAIAPGALRRTWTEGDRRYFDYATEAPIGNGYRFFSAKYAVREDTWRDSRQEIAIQIFHHPHHTQHLDRIMRSAHDALSYYTEHFGPYPFRHLRLIEHPGPGKGAHADANTIDFMEGFSLLNPKPDRDVDLPYHIIAHEIAHQWWGTQLTPAYAEGAGVLVESLATYSALLMGKDTLGEEHARRYLRFVRLEYQNPRSPAMPPLLRAADSFLNYRKGPLALYALGEYIGHERVRDALRTLLHKHGSPRAAALATTLDLYRELKAVTPDSAHWLLHDLFEENTFWHLETTRARAEQKTDGTWLVTLDVTASKETIDEAGLETTLPMNDWVEIGAYEDGALTPFHLEKQRITAGEQQVTVVVPRKPSRAGIDPRFLLVDWNTADNIESVTIRQTPDPN